MGINFIVSPPPSISTQSNLRFQQSLDENGIEIGQTMRGEQEITLIRKLPNRLEIKIARLSIQAAAPSSRLPNTGQLLILAPGPGSSCGMFVREVQAVVSAFNSTWPVKSRQILKCDATFRDLYETSAEHAFQELWEMRLNQPKEALEVFKRPVLGGGLRLVMPPKQGEDEPIEIELKIESFFRDTKKIYIETTFRWLQPVLAETQMDTKGRLERIYAFVEDEVQSFVTGG
jgi:hypothetical protein